MKFKVSLLVLLVLLVVWSAFQPNGILVTLQQNFWSLDLVNRLMAAPDQLNQISLLPTTPHSTVLLAREAIRKQQLQFAEETLSPLLSYQDRAVQGTEAEVLYSSGGKTEAFRIWEEFNETILLERAANQASQEGDAQYLLEAYRSLYRIDPEKYTSGLAFTLKAQGKNTEAEELLLLSRSEYLNSEYGSDWLRYLADIYVANGDWQRAEGVYLETIQENADDGRAWRNLGLLYLSQLNMPEKAIECFQQIVSRFPSETYGYSYLAQSYEKIGDIEKALQTYQNLLIVSPGDSSALQAVERLTLELISIP